MLIININVCFKLKCSLSTFLFVLNLNISVIVHALKYKKSNLACKFQCDYFKLKYKHVHNLLLCMNLN